MPQEPIEPERPELNHGSVTAQRVTGLASQLVPGFAAIGILMLMVGFPFSVPWISPRHLKWVLPGAFLVILVGSCYFTAWIFTADMLECRRKHRCRELTLLLMLGQTVITPFVGGLILLFLQMAA